MASVASDASGVFSGAGVGVSGVGTGVFIVEISSGKMGLAVLRLVTDFLVEGLAEGFLAVDLEVDFLGAEAFEVVVFRVVVFELLTREGVAFLERRVVSPSIDLFESIVYNYSMKVQKITKKQQAVLNFLEDFTEENGYSPSYREIQSGLGLSSVSAVAEHIDNMVSKGILKKVPGAARSLEVLDFRHTETVELFKARMAEASEEEKKILVAAAEVLGLDLE